MDTTPSVSQDTDEKKTSAELSVLCAISKLISQSDETDGQSEALVDFLKFSPVTFRTTAATTFKTRCSRREINLFWDMESIRQPGESTKETFQKSYDRIGTITFGNFVVCPWTNSSGIEGMLSKVVSVAILGNKELGLFISKQSTSPRSKQEIESYKSGANSKSGFRATDNGSAVSTIRYRLSDSAGVILESRCRNRVDMKNTSQILETFDATARDTWYDNLNDKATLNIQIVIDTVSTYYVIDPIESDTTTP